MPHRLPLPEVVIVDRDLAQQILRHESDLGRKSELRCVLSINDYESRVPDGFDAFRRHKLALFFDDVLTYEDGWIPPEPEDARKIIAWARAVDGPTLVHCAAGKSRSTASAIAIPASRWSVGRANAREIMNWLVKIRSVAAPNPLLVDMIDDNMGWCGELSDARGWKFGR